MGVCQVPRRRHGTLLPEKPMREKILITGAEGLVGRALSRHLTKRGYDVAGLDLRAPEGRGRGDVRSAGDVEAAIHGAAGVVHLAAVSRVIHGERDPELCWATNVGGTSVVLDAARSSPKKPWVLFASSREVYGEPSRLPVGEDAPLAPVNIYGRSKVAGEELVSAARRSCLCTAIVRLSNVYGGTNDHEDRVVPAFVSAAMRGGTLRVEGGDHTFDFTHIDDTTVGLSALVDALFRGEELPPIHLLTGRPTTLRALAELAVELSGRRASIVERPPRSYDVGMFCGDPTRARERLGFTAQTSIREGISKMMNVPWEGSAT